MTSFIAVKVRPPESRSLISLALPPSTFLRSHSWHGIEPQKAVRDTSVLQMQVYPPILAPFLLDLTHPNGANLRR